MRRTLRLGFWIGLLAVAAWLVQRSRQRDVEVATPAARLPIVEPELVEVGDLSAPGEPEVDTTAADESEAWVVPDPGGMCPASHPIKAKLRSKLFHLPGMLAYDRTNPDRCYRDEAAAEADGLTRAKR